MEAKSVTVAAVVFLLVLISVMGQLRDPEPEKLLSNPCKSKTSCGECIAADPQCAWCSRENFTEEGVTRCDLMWVLDQSTCGPSNIESPANQQEVVKRKSLSKAGGTIEDVVQLAPQEVKLKLRPNDPYKLQMKFRQALDFPLDLYYLVDLSNSMEDHKDKLISLANRLAKEMGRITTDFRLGFGSFVGKKLKEPCTNCAAPYEFKNHMALSSDTKTFADQVKMARLSGNVDGHGSAVDAIMQSVVCNNEIGWRPRSRKILLFSTNSGYHFAGEGNLGGIITANDGFCHLNQEGFYTLSTEQDHPSLSQLRHKIRRNMVNIIFAVTAGQVPDYMELSRKLEGAYTGQLADDSGNVVDLVLNQNLQTTSQVQMKDNATNNVKVTYFSKCLGGKLEKTNVCNGLRVGTEVEFTVEMEVTSCPKDEKARHQTFQIYPVGLNEALVVHLDMICDCQCELPDKQELFSPKCFNLGTYECGVCSCYNNRFGRRCECNSWIPGMTDYNALCRGGNDRVECSGRGTCNCGVCNCNVRPNPEEIIYGQLCECDNFSCDRHAGLLCHGKGRGKCSCGICECEPGWGGTACQCEQGSDTCIQPGTNEVCSGKGECRCGQCQCVDRYTGRYCEKCPTCPDKCMEFKACVQCQTFQTGELKDNCNCNFTTIKMAEVKVEKQNERLCVFKDEDDCKFTYVYGYDENNNPRVRVQETKG